MNKHKAIGAILAAVFTVFFVTSEKAWDWFKSLPVHYMVLVACLATSLLLAVIIRQIFF